MCTEGLKDPVNGLPYRKRTKCNHTSGILDHLLTEHRQCPKDHEHQPIEGMTKYKDHTGKWRTINRSTFAGWYTREFCEDVVDNFTQEFALQDAREAAKQKPTSSTKCVRFHLPKNQVLPTQRTGSKIPRGPYLPTKFLKCEFCPSQFSSLPARRQHMLTQRPAEYKEYQLQLQ